MSRYTGPKYKRERRLGTTLGLKTKPTKRIEFPPGQHGRKGKRNPSDYSVRLAEKQKLKWTYDTTERQLRNYYEKAMKEKGNSGERLLQLLEQRLDNIIYRLGFMPTRAAARQLVSHGHVRVNEKKVNIPSYLAKTGEVITLSKKALEIPLVKENLKEKREFPKWLNRKGPVGMVVAIPSRDQILLDVNEQLIIEFYSR